MWRTKIISGTIGLALGTEFELKEVLNFSLINPNFTNTQKRSLGKVFYHDVLAGLYSNISFVRKDSQSHCVYVII